MAEILVPSMVPTIQGAIDTAQPGDTIRIAAGLYHESLTIPAGKESLRLVGDGLERTVINGHGRLACGIQVEGAHCSISHLAIRGFSADGIRTTGAGNHYDHLLLERNGRHGIELTATAEQCVLADLIVRRNQVDGIYVVKQTVLRANQAIENGATGIVANGPGNRLENNQAEGNGAQGIAIAGVGNELHGNRAAQNQDPRLGAGILVAGSGHRLEGNVAHQNGRCGVELIGVERSTVKENEVGQNRLGGIYLRGGLANELVANLIRTNGQAGIHLEGPASQNLIAANQVLTNRGPGIALGPTAAGNLVQENRLRQNNPDLRATLPAQTANRFVLNECQTSFPTGLSRRPTPQLGAAQPSPVQDNGRPSH